MTISVTHTFVSPITDAGETGIVGPDEWNDTHTVTGAADAVTQIIAGAGLTGGGTLASDRTLAVGAGTGITVNADDVAVDQSFSPTWTGTHTWTTSASGGIPVIIQSTNADAVAGPIVQLYRNSASPAVSDPIGDFIFTGNNDTGVVKTYGGLLARILDPTTGSEDGQFEIQTLVAGSQAVRVRVAQGLMIGTSTDPGVGLINTNSATFMIGSKTTYANGAGALTGTLTNSPATGNPTKWIPVDDNGTTRYIPAW